VRQRLQRIAELLYASDILVLVAVAPALLFPSPASSLALLALPLLWVAAWARTGHFIARTPLDWPILLLLSMTLVSVAVSVDLVYSLPKITGVLWGASVYYACARRIQTPGQARLAALLYGLLGAGLATIGLVGINWLDKWPGLRGITEQLPGLIRGLPGAEEGFHPNTVAGSLVLIVPVVALDVLRRWRDRRARRGGADPANQRVRIWLLVEAAALGLMAATLVLTQSRGAWLGLLAAGVLAVVVWAARRWRWGWAALLGLAAAAALSLAVIPDQALESAGHTAGLLTDSSLSSREEVWSRAIDAIEDFPLTGLGYNGFRRVLPVLYPTLLNPYDAEVAHAHNHWLQAALDVGLPGLIAYLALWLAAGAALARAGRLTQDPELRLLATGLGVGFLAHNLFSLTDTIALGSKAGIFVWLGLALAVGASQVAGRAAGSKPDLSDPDTVWQRQPHGASRAGAQR
jgi:putative inorganic carbon (HCO3(-)) transporter